MNIKTLSMLYVLTMATSIHLSAENIAESSKPQDIADIDKPLDLISSAQAKIEMKALIESLAKNGDAETQQMLKEMSHFADETFDTTRAPVLAFGAMFGADFALQHKIGSNWYLGGGTQIGLGGLITRHKKKSTTVWEQFGLNAFNLSGGGAHLKYSSTPIKTFTKQGFFGLVLIIPHLDENGAPKVKRLKDLRNWYYGFAAEGAIPLKYINRIRGSLGVYALLSSKKKASKSDLLMAKADKEIILESANDSQNWFSQISNLISKTPQATLNAYKNVSDATMIVFTPQVGKDAPIEIQGEGLWLGLSESLSSEDLLDALPFLRKNILKQILQTL